MTDGFAALATLAQEAGEGGPQSGRRAGARQYGGGAGGDVKTALARRALDDFYARYRDEPPAVDKWLAVLRCWPPDAFPRRLPRPGFPWASLSKFPRIFLGRRAAVLPYGARPFH